MYVAANRYLCVGNTVLSLLLYKHRYTHKASDQYIIAFLKYTIYLRIGRFALDAGYLATTMSKESIGNCGTR